MGEDSHDSARTVVARPGGRGRGEDEAVRAQEAAAAAVGSSPPTGGSAVAVPVASSRDAMFREELARTRAFSMLTLGICVIALAGLPLLGGDPLLKTITMSGCALSVLTSLWLIIAYRDPARYRQWVMTTMASVSVLLGHAGILYWGIASPAPMLMLFGVYIFARGQSFGPALVVYLLAALSQGSSALLFASGVVDDPGLMTSEDSPEHVRVVTQISVQAVFAAVFLFARSSRRGTLRAMDELISAQRQAAQREAAFQELRQDFDRVFEVGGAGHYTDRVLGRWRLGNIVGRGAMGEVYEAAHTTSGDQAAVKILHPNVLAKPSSVERFLREARAASSLDSPHAVRVYEIGPAESPVPYLVMELLRGRDLGYFLRQRRRLPLPELAALLEQMGSVIDSAGAHGIVHRDLKPQNLFLAERQVGEPVWKVLDFGASKLADNSGTLTQGRVVGTPSYMSPQQARGEDVDSAADRYALAAIAYRCITGRPPFTGKDLPTTLYRVVYGTPPQPSTLAEVPEGIDDVLAIGLAKRPGDRFATGAELADAFALAAAGARDIELMRRAERLVSRHPWGTTPSYRG